MAGEGGGEATLPPLERALNLGKGHREAKRQDSGQPYFFWLLQATQSTLNSPLRPKIEGLCCHYGGGRVLEVRGAEGSSGDLARSRSKHLRRRRDARPERPHTRSTTTEFTVDSHADSERTHLSQPRATHHELSELSRGGKPWQRGGATAARAPSGFGSLQRSPPSAPDSLGSLAPRKQVGPGLGSLQAGANAGMNQGPQATG